MLSEEGVEFIKQYLDKLLTLYTGKSGIFNSKITFIGRRKKGDFKQAILRRQKIRGIG